MATALDIIAASATLVGALGTGEVLNAAESTDGLNALNDLLESWSSDRLFVYRVAETAVTWPAATASRTIGLGGDINIARPLKIEKSYITVGGRSYDVMPITKYGYDSLGLKTLQGIPEWIYYDPAFPLGIIDLYPVPSASTALTLNSWLLLPSFATLTDVVVLPPGYSRALKYNLAIDLAPYLGMPVPPSVEVIAASSAAKIKRMNLPEIPAMIEVAAFQRRTFDIVRGY